MEACLLAAAAAPGTPEKSQITPYLTPSAMLQ
jgi:hypothetical protein